MARREWGSGACYQAGRYWRVAISEGSDATGGRRRRQWQFTTKARAEAKLHEISGRLRRGLPAEDSDVTLAAYVPTWLGALRTRVRPSTFAFYESLASTHLDELRGYRLTRIGPPDIRRLIAAREEAGYASRTVRAILDVIRLILRQAEVDGIVERNVATLIDPPRLIQAEPVHLTADQARRFLEVAREDPQYGLYAVALGTGLRRGELLGLSWRDVDLERGIVTVRRSKTAAGVRTIPLAGFAVDALAALDRRPGPIFPVSPSYATHHVAVICDRAGVPRVTFHQLRHSTASLLLAADVSPLVIQQILGHSRAAMTGHYARSEEAQQREAMERLDAALG